MLQIRRSITERFTLYKNPIDPTTAAEVLIHCDEEEHPLTMVIPAAFTGGPPVTMDLELIERLAALAVSRRRARYYSSEETCAKHGYHEGYECKTCRREEELLYSREHPPAPARTEPTPDRVSTSDIGDEIPF